MSKLAAEWVFDIILFMNIKRFIYNVFCLLLSSICFSAENRYIVFFAETADISNVVIDKIALSHRFCMVVPQDCKSTIPENLEGLISVGKIEPALYLFPEPVLPIFAEISNTNFKKNKNAIFENYISDNLSSFIKNRNKEHFGMFLSCAKMSHDLLYYFSDLGLSWINVDNIEENIYGAYYVDGIAIFSLYKNFPYSQQEVMKWLESKHEDVFPILLTKKHLQDAKFMEYIIGIFDGSKYIKPATPLYIASVENTMLQKKDISFEKVSINPNIFEKLQSAAEAINNYANSSSFSEIVHSNAQSELAYLCEQDVLKKASSDSSTGKRMFDAAYTNIYRLLGLQTKGLMDTENIDEQQTVPTVDIQKKSTTLINGQTSVEVVPGGVSIHNDGLLKSAQIISTDNTIKIEFSFIDDIGLRNEVSFIDFYIDLNGISGMGGSSFIHGISGFLAADSGWEYALRIYRDTAILYKHSVDGAAIISNFIVNDNSVSIPTKYIRGNPDKWGLQAIVVSENANEKTIIDFFNQGPKTKAELISAKPFQAPLVRCKQF
ncbi:MAG: hypothetical protein LBD17_05610 [Endomicrobium sp.]|jgi:hypothetical protein|nr:hypothetical protein [Endomicrobium sp.]